MKTTSAIPVKMLTRTALLLALTVAIQAMRLPSVFTGPLVNLMLVLSTLMVGVSAGVLIGTLTPCIALVVGIIPPPMAPAVPFIMAGNAILCLLVGTFADNSHAMRYIGLIVGSILKFAIIGGAATFVLTLPVPLTHALMYPQLSNALIGGFVAISALTTVYPAVAAHRS